VLDGSTPRSLLLGLLCMLGLHGFVAAQTRLLLDLLCPARMLASHSIIDAPSRPLLSLL